MAFTDSVEIAIFCLGIISMIFYGITYFPQFYEIYSKKSSEGVSIWAVLLWTQADALSLTSSILLNLDQMIIIICWYHFFMDILMVTCVLYYAKLKDRRMMSYSAIFVASNILTNILVNVIYYGFPNQTQTQTLIGEIIAWITTVIYIVGRVPQILQLEKSIEGLSVLMYIFTILGNSSYLALLLLQDQHLANLPWIVLGGCLILLDIYVILRIHIKKQQLQVSLNELLL
jgi:uncharacterized protein with PQ loop repeat